MTITTSPLHHHHTAHSDIREKRKATGGILRRFNMIVLITIVHYRREKFGTSGQLAGRLRFGLGDFLNLSDAGYAPNLFDTRSFLCPYFGLGFGIGYGIWLECLLDNIVDITSIIRQYCLTPPTFLPPCHGDHVNAVVQLSEASQHTFQTVLPIIPPPLTPLIDTQHFRLGFSFPDSFISKSKIQHPRNSHPTRHRKTRHVTQRRATNHSSTHMSSSFHSPLPCPAA
jgi:hypothetical protein